MDEKTKDIIRKSPRGRIVIELSDERAIFDAITYKEFQLAIKRGDRYIVTPLTTAIDNYYCLMGYRVVVKSEEKQFCLNDALLGFNLKENDKELKLSHNTEKLILNGVYDLQVYWKQKKEESI